MTIKDLLKTTHARITLYNRWLIMNGVGYYMIYERKPYAKKTVIIYSGIDEEEAIKNLMTEE